MMENSYEILLVEDRKEDAELALIGLGRLNLVNSIIWVKDGSEALEFLYEYGRYENRGGKNPKLILLDIHMPKVNGLEVLQKIRSTPSTAHIPVVVLSTSKEERDLVEAYNLHANAYILKPIDFTNFMDAMATIGSFWLLLNQSPRDVKE